MELKDLWDCIVDQYTIEELKDLCLLMGINDQQLKTDTINTFARELIRHCKSIGQYHKLIEEVSARCDTNLSPTTGKLRDHDFVIVSDCHSSLSKTRNLIKNTLGIPYLESGINEKVAQLSKEALENGPVLLRIMGADWHEELMNTVVQAVTLTARMSGRDYLAEASVLNSRTEDEAKAFFGEFQQKNEVLERLDHLISGLEVKLK